MLSSNFTELYSLIEQIIEITDKVPASMKDEIFKTLFDAAKKNSNSEKTCKEMIINLSQNSESIRDFLDKVKPNSNIERSLSFVFYLEQLGMRSITAKHISACYEIAMLDEPGNLSQNLRDACSARYSYLETEQSYFHTTEKGRNFLQRSQSEKE